MLQYKLHHYLFLFLTLAMTLTLPQNSIGQTVPPVEKYSISPTQALAKNPFKLNLLGGNWPCQTTFSRESVLVTGKRIDLSFIVNLNVTPMPYILSNDVPVPSLSPICIMPLSNLDTIGPVYVSGPVFSVPALAVGQYEVWATQMVECLYTQPMCKIAVIPILVGTLNVTAQGAITYTINPTTTPLKKDFTLDLLSYQFNCGTTYDMLASSVTGNTIALTFLDHENPLTACPAIYKPYGPSYKMTGLPAGKYDVKVYHLPACAAQHCPFAAITPEDAGILTVTDSTQRKGWFLKNHSVLATAPFTMQLLNYSFGNCQTTFSNASVSASVGGIYTSFLIENHPDNVCIMDLRPYGPYFDMTGLAVGMYPVYVTELLKCEVTVPRCLVDRITPIPSDTLLVTKTVSILLSELRAKTPQVTLQGTRAQFILPAGGSGVWAAELLTLSGRRLASSSLQGKSGTLVGMELGRKVEQGIYLIRLSSQNKVTYMLPVIRKD